MIICPDRSPQTFQVQAKISTVRPVFPEYLSVSYDYVFTKQPNMVTNSEVHPSFHEIATTR